MGRVVHFALARNWCRTTELATAVAPAERPVRADRDLLAGRRLRVDQGDLVGLLVLAGTGRTHSTLQPLHRLKLQHVEPPLQLTTLRIQLGVALGG